MFRCQDCGTVSQPGVKPVRRVVEIRNAVHPRRWSIRTPDFIRSRPTDPSAEFDVRDVEWVVDSGGFGTQIVREKTLCQLCDRKAAPVQVPEPVDFVVFSIGAWDPQDKNVEEAHASRATRA